jgi:hypothetical protein
MPSGAITIHGGSGTDTISYAFTVTGTNTLRYAQSFANSVNHLIGSTASGGLGDSIVQISQFGAPSAAPASPTVYELVPPSSGLIDSPFLVGGPGYIVDTIGGALTVKTAVGGDSILVAAINAATTFDAAGGNNLAIFVDGNNTYNATATDTGNDTIVAGSGFDTIYTAAAGSTTVNSGTGDATIYLQDTGSGAFNDHVWLDDGSSTVYANGTGDAVIATTAGQTIIGGTVAGASLGVALLPNSSGAVNGNDAVTAGAGTTTVWDDSSNNSITGGSGTLYFVAAANVEANITSGSGNIFGFAGAGDTINIGGNGTGTVYFDAGTGNATLDGAGGTSTMYLFGGGSSSTSQDLIGGNGHDVITAGAGSETLTGGTGTNAFQFIDGLSTGGNMVITDFGTNSNLLLDGFTQADVTKLMSGGTESGGNYSVTLSNSLTLTFDGVTSGSALAGHIISF